MGLGIIIFFIIVGIVCCLVVLCYLEFVFKLLVVGSVYIYSYYVFGEGVVWILGWLLILEYGLVVVVIVSGWFFYMKSLLVGFDLYILMVIFLVYDLSVGIYFDLFVFVVVMVIGILFSFGICEFIWVNNIMVLVKIVVVVLFILVGVFYVKFDNWMLFLLFGV